jgi:hypothetical protein
VEVHAQPLAGEAPLIFAAEGVVGAARLAGGQHDAGGTAQSASRPFTGA